MKVSELKQLIKEAVKAAVKEELAELKLPIQEHYARSQGYPPAQYPGAQMPMYQDRMEAYRTQHDPMGLTQGIQQPPMRSFKKQLPPSLQNNKFADFIDAEFPA